MLDEPDFFKLGDRYQVNGDQYRCIYILNRHAWLGREHSNGVIGPGIRWRTWADRGRYVSVDFPGEMDIRSEPDTPSRGS